VLSGVKHSRQAFASVASKKTTDLQGALVSDHFTVLEQHHHASYAG
jgi:hypothetical protein